MTTSSAVESDSSPQPNNRRECFRINDRIGMRIRVLNDSEFLQAKAGAVSKHQRQHLLNDMIVASQSRRAALRGIREESPAIADYLADLDKKLNNLANLMTQEDSQAPRERTHDVNLSASGIRFYSDEGYSPGAHLELHVHLFPSDTCLRLYGTVAWCRHGDQSDADPGPLAVAVDYSEIPDEDREILFRHINNLQLDFVRRGVRPTSD